MKNPETADDINTVLPPNDEPAVWLSCDLSYGRACGLIDVWTKAPRRHVSNNGAAVDRSVEYVGDRETHIGTLKPTDVYDRFGVCPSGDECISIDNPHVN